ncbi:MAG: peptidylprolyl isomerase [Acidobacteriota bacterium]
MKRSVILSVVGLATAVVAASQSPSGISSRQAYLLQQIDSWSVSTSMWVAMVNDPYPSVRARAMQAVASNVGAQRIELASLYIRDPDPLVREQVMLAAGRLGPDGLQLARQGLGDGSPAVRQAAAWAACLGGPEAFAALARLLLTERSRPVLETTLANLWRLEGMPWETQAARYVGHTDVYLRRAAAYSLSRTDSQAARPAQRELATDSEAVIRATALQGFGRGELSDVDLKVVLDALDDSDWRVRAAACRALAAHDSLEISEAAAREISREFSSPYPQLAVSAIAAAGRQPGVGTTSELRAVVQSGEPWLAAEALQALSRRDPGGAAKIARSWLADSTLWRRRAAARTAVRLGEEIEALATADSDPAVRLAWLESLSPQQAGERTEELLAIVSNDPDVPMRTQALSLLRANGSAPGVTRLLKFYREWASDEMPDARAEAIVAALAASDAGAQRDGVLEIGLTDPNPAVAAMVTNGARGLGDEAALPPRQARHEQSWYQELTGWVDEPRWLDVVTVRGTFRVRLDLDATPITSREIWDLASRGFYDGLDFHRVVPNFVVQGGDPRGDGWGWPGFVLADEPSLNPFDSWRVGIATSGPNTGGCQFFVTLMPADHLTGHYTNFGEVVAGREVLTRVEVGDRILRVRTLAGAEPPPLPPVLVGELSWADLAAVPGWEEERAAYQPDEEAVEKLRMAGAQYEILVVLGTWCSDSKREVPRLEKIVEAVGSETLATRFIGVDRTKWVRGLEFPPGLLPDDTAERVPTIIVIGADGEELGRVVETAQHPLEQMLVDFVVLREGQPEADNSAFDTM